MLSLVCTNGSTPSSSQRTSGTAMTMTDVARALKLSRISRTNMPMRYFAVRQPVVLDDEVFDQITTFEYGDTFAIYGDRANDWMPCSQLIECSGTEHATRIGKLLKERGPFPNTWEYPRGLWV